MKNVKQLILNNFNVIYYDADQLNFKCLIKLKTNPNDLNLNLKYKDLKKFINTKQKSTNVKNAKFISAEDGDNVCLITQDDILSIKCSRDGLMLADMLDNISQEIDKSIKGWLLSDNLHENAGYDTINELIDKKRRILQTLHIDYESLK